MEKILYLDCSTGISGDMMVAALLDLGADWEVLLKVLSSLSVDGFTVGKSRVKKAGLDCMDFAVYLDGEHENHDHDMAYLHGEGEGHIHSGEWNHEGEHSHRVGSHHGGKHSHSLESHHEGESSHCHGRSHEEEHIHGSEMHGHHSHAHRGMAEILAILNQADMTEGARKLAEKIFQVLAKAEAKAHGVPVEQVHFHEVGAVDSIVDIVSVAVCLDNLHIKDVVVTKLCEGTGTVRCQHGILPIPVPAVANILEEYRLPLEILQVQGEFVTPTGAAIVAAIRTKNTLPDSFTIQKIGMGAGKRTYARPSLLRAMLISDKSKEKDVIYKLESDIDDSTGEQLGFAMDKLLEAGARDVHYFPVYMKKNRPGWQLNVICDEEQVELLENIIFKETTTIGIRRQKMERRILPREIRTLQTKYGPAQVKVCTLGEQKKYYPECESVTNICRKADISFDQAYREILSQIERDNKGKSVKNIP